MKVYTAHSRSPLSGDPARDTDGLVFVKDGFSIWAAVFPLVWFLVHRMWFPVLGYLAFSIGFSFLTRALGLSDGAIFPVALVLGLLIGFEANTLRRWSLARKGYAIVAIGSGATREECERRIYEKIVGAAQLPSVSERVSGVAGNAAPDAPRKTSDTSRAIVGLFPGPVPGAKPTR
jgi:hypothetical protein